MEGPPQGSWQSRVLPHHGLWGLAPAWGRLCGTGPLESQCRVSPAPPW